jgi:disease resistance protein RPM1
MTTDYYFTNIPKWIAPALTCLAKLDINLTQLSEDGLHTLGELPALLHLILSLKQVGCRITVEGKSFPSLRQFVINSPKGTYLKFVKGAMPKLECLDLNLAVSVGRNYDFYLGLAHLPFLKEEVDAHANNPRWYEVNRKPYRWE